MRNKSKTKGKRTQAASYKAVVASVTKEMAQPRVAESAQLTAAERRKKKRGERTSRHAGKRRNLTSKNTALVLPLKIRS